MEYRANSDDFVVVVDSLYAANRLCEQPRTHRVIEQIRLGEPLRILTAVISGLSTTLTPAISRVPVSRFIGALPMCLAALSGASQWSRQRLAFSE